MPTHQMESAIVLAQHNFNQLDKRLKYMLSFSCGKDSIVLLEMALSYGISPIVYHQYIIDGLSYNEAVMDYYRARGIEIKKWESGMVAKMQMGDLLCINKVFDIKSGKWNPLEKTERIIASIVNFDINLLGIKQNDSPNRRMVINKYGWLQMNVMKAYPIYHLTDKQVWNYIYEYNLPVNACYQMFGRSQDVVNYTHLHPMKEKAPKDLELFIHKFPLIESLFWIKDKRANKIKGTTYKFSKNAKQGNEYNYSVSLDNFLILCFETFEEKETYCTMHLGDALTVYVEGKYYELKKEQQHILKLERETYDDNLLGRVGEFADGKQDKNNLDNFLILFFESKTQKENYCHKYIGDKDVNCVDGIEYKIE